jgi:site-specific DNA-methyltransferase (adenine-specific)
MSSHYIIGDIHEVIKNLDDKSVDLIYTNPPFGTTQKTWDIGLDWDTLFTEMFRVLKDTGVILLHTAKPFTYKIIATKEPKYHYTWVKKNHTHFFHAKRQPLRKLEEVLVYYKKSAHTYNPQMIGDELIVYKVAGGCAVSGYYSSNGKLHKPHTSVQHGKYPHDFLGEFPRVSQKKTPKSVPDEITKRMIKTYSNEGDTILDMTCCSRGNGNIAKALGRNYIGVDISDEYLQETLCENNVSIGI